MITLQHYLSHRKRYEILAWISLILLPAIANAVVVNLDLQRFGQSFDWWEPVIWEFSSAATLLALIPAILAFDQRFPLRRPNLRRHLPAHMGFSLVFSILHVAGMVALRHLGYHLLDRQYDFGPWLEEWAYEYLKDFRSYALIISIIYAYDFILRRLQGEASLPDRGESESAAADRFLVKKLGKEFLVKITDIDWLEAAGNYVNLHAHDRIYPLRDTMANLEQRLAEHGFARVHRSAIVNLDRIAQIQPFDTGDARARLTSGVEIPVSRRYRAQLRERLET